MTLLILGRRGQVARALVEQGSERPDLNLVSIGRPDVDLEVPGSLADAIERIRPEIVINAAAYTAVDQAEDEPERALRINAEAVEEAARAARSVGARLIHLSTDYVFDGTADQPYDESAVTSPIGVYGHSKLAGEQRVAEHGGDWTIVRTAWVYSPFSRNFVRTIMGAAGQRDRLRVVGDQWGSPTSATDLASALMAIVDRWRAGEAIGLGATYHVAGSGTASWYDVAVETMAQCRAIGAASADVDAITTAEWPTRAARPRYSVLDCGRFERDFGVRLPDWRASLRDVVTAIARNER